MTIAKILAAALSVTVLLSAATTGAAVIADHAAADAFDQIPDSDFAVLGDGFDIFYGHTSHGSQVVSGMDMLKAENELYTPPVFHEYYDDLGASGDTTWVQPTRDWLDAHPECNMVMWSWCGGVAWTTEAGIDVYLQAMTDLELQYPEVTFVYMTGHLDGTGPDGNLYRRNNQIRDYCATNDKVLFDFADIESWDPDGNYYPDDDDGCQWCYQWCETHPCPDCSYCAHSHCFNCYRKGRAFWWLLKAVHDGSTTGIGRSVRPATIGLTGYPNPFNPRTEIVVESQRGGAATLSVYDAGGRLVTTLFRGDLPAGRHTFTWDGCDDHGRRRPSGTYLCALAVDGRRHLLRMTLVK